MSNHFGNPLIPLSPRVNSPPFLASKAVEKDNHHHSNHQQQRHRRNQSLTCLNSLGPAVSPTTSHITIARPSAIQTTQSRSKSFTGPHVVTPAHSYEMDSSSSEEHTIDELVRKRSSLTVIGLPSEYPIHQRCQDSVSSIANSSICSGLLMEELDDFELFFGADQESVPKVYDSGSSEGASPLKCDHKCHPPKPPLQRPAHIRSRAVSEDSALTPTEKHMKQSRVFDNASIDSRDTMSSATRRRRNYGLNDNDFQKLTNDFSFLTVESNRED